MHLVAVNNTQDKTLKNKYTAQKREMHQKCLLIARPDTSLEAMLAIHTMGGRWGNLLFQYASVLGIAAHTGKVALVQWKPQADPSKDLSNAISAGFMQLLRAKTFANVSVARHCWPEGCSQLASWKFDPGLSGLSSG
jgi:hypothetical protein